MKKKTKKLKRISYGKKDRIHPWIKKPSEVTLATMFEALEAYGKDIESELWHKVEFAKHELEKFFVEDR